MCTIQRLMGGSVDCAVEGWCFFLGGGGGEGEKGGERGGKGGRWGGGAPGGDPMDWQLGDGRLRSASSTQYPYRSQDAEFMALWGTLDASSCPSCEWGVWDSSLKDVWCWRRW